MFTIYYFRNTKTNEYYVGQTSNYEYRINQHLEGSKRPSNRLTFALHNYGIDNFEIGIIKSNVETKCEAKELEKYYIKYYNSYLCGYNMSPGGEINHLGEKRTPEQCKNISEGTKKGMSKPEVKDKMSTFWNKYYKTHDPWNKGIKTGPNPKLSESKKGKPLVYHISPEELFKIRSEANKKTNADRHWYTNGEEDKRIRSYEIETYESLGWKKGRTQANGKNKKHVKKCQNIT